MADVQKTLMPVLIVPLVLVLLVTVFSSTQDATVYSWENTITNESTGLTGDGTSQTATSDRHCKVDSVTSAYNGTTLMTAVTDYNVTYSNLGVCTINTSVDAGAVVMTYTGLNGSGYTAFDNIGTQTYSGFKLASILPYVIVAMMVLGLVITAFKI
ncbi:MAG: hypothetical protein ACTSPI_03500 [Candidatus Heimdallarchaeaceae archaeon]